METQHQPRPAKSPAAKPLLSDDASVVAQHQAVRMAQPGGWLRFDSGWLDTKQVLRNLETSVSVLQQAEQDIERIRQKIASCLTVLNGHWEVRSTHSQPTSVLNQCLQSATQQIDDIVRSSKFHGRGLLNGQSSVIGWGNGVGFLRGGPNTKPSPKQGFAVDISHHPTRSSLSGHVPLHPSFMDEEQEVVLVEGGLEVRVPMHKSESPSDFVLRLQTEIWRAGLSLEAKINHNGRLAVQHHHYGSQHIFRGLSHRTAILSKQPGQLETSLKGKDIQGELSGEPAFGVGRMLVGLLDNQRTAELAVCWMGECHLGKDEDIRCHVRQNSMFVQETAAPESETSTITLPWCRANQLGTWVDTSSGFLSLSDARCHSWLEVKDAMHMLYSISYELTDWLEKIHQAAKSKQDTALAKLKYVHSANPVMVERRSLNTVHQKVNVMACMLQKAMAGD